MSKKLMVLWFLVIFVMCFSLLVIHYNTLDKDLLKIEKEVKVASKKYFKDRDMLPSLNETSIVFIDNLIKEEYIKESEKIEKYCIDSVKVNNKLFIYVYEVVRDCDEVLKEAE